MDVGSEVSFTTGSGWSHHGRVGRVVALGPDLVAIEVDGQHFTKKRGEVYPGRIAYARRADGGFLRESALEYAARIDEAIRAAR